MKAMILAAGRGERLMPVTHTTPKALIEINGRPLIIHHILNLKTHGITDIVINTAYLGKKIEQYVGDGRAFGVSIRYSQESNGGLETGGGIVNALPLLGNAPFITLNSDIYSTFNLSQLPNLTNSLGHLILVNNPPHNPKGDYSIDRNFLSNRQDLNKYTFSGIAVYHPDLFSQQRVDKFSITPLIKKKADEQAISAEITSAIWHDIGTIKRLETARRYS